MKNMTPDDLKGLLGGLRTELFRLETRQTYLVPQEVERLRAFREGRRLPPRSPDELQLVRDLLAAGVRVYRVHAVAQPLSEYVRFELIGYRDGVEAGEEIYLADQTRHPDLGQLHDDFLLFDNETVVWVRYDDEGHHIGWARDDSRAAQERCRHARDVAMAHAVPLDEYTVSSNP
jgi:hypothetical protein